MAAKKNDASRLWYGEYEGNAILSYHRSIWFAPLPFPVARTKPSASLIKLHFVSFKNTIN